MQDKHISVKFIDNAEVFPSVQLLDHIAHISGTGEGIFEFPNEYETISQTRQQREKVLSLKHKQFQEIKSKKLAETNEKLLKQREKELQQLAKLLENPNKKPSSAKEKPEKSWLSRVFNW
jgi:recombinational DNA repair ATPase RecF